MDKPLSERKAARFTAALNSGVNMTPIRECTLADRAAWANAALKAYNRQAPKALLPVPELAERVRLGVLAAEAMAQIAFNIPGDRVVDDQERADRVIGDLVAQVFCLTDGRVTAHELHQAAERLRSDAYPVRLDVLCAVVAAGAEREAAMLAALLDAAQSFGCDVPGMVDSARAYFEELKAEDEEADAARA
ncbi:hypothetical protein AS594_36280 [Streptomyces agglomeratus]|uniref:Uncharacterized protein n=1 Tax=Streptomyces agglomeratus TaxID=285458 RepID=A0A1E5PHP8_9ACTN|nr:hypothetical protein [Streptomyces agglomeratus]OEJ29059.1 hypothetical protein AS594_36280 [Streptomyces agglomeratus]